MFDSNSLFVLPLEGVDVKEGKGDGNYILTLNLDNQGRNKTNVLWFSDRPNRDSGSIAPRKLFRRKHWDLAFGNSNPNAALSYFDDDGTSSVTAFEMKQRPKRDKITGNFQTKIKLLDNGASLDEGSLTKASLFIDPSGLDIGTAAADAVGLGFIGYKVYTAGRAWLQRSALAKQQEILDNEVKGLFDDAGSGLYEQYSKRLFRYIEKLETFKGETGDWSELKTLIKEDDFTKNIIATYQDALSDLDFANSALKDEIAEALGDGARVAAMSAHGELQGIYENDGLEGVLNKYNDLFNVEPTEFLTNPELFSDFSTVMKASRGPLAKSVATAKKQIYKELERAGYNIGDASTSGELDSSIASEVSPEIADTVTSEVAGLEEGEFGVGEFLEALTEVAL